MRRIRTSPAEAAALALLAFLFAVNVYRAATQSYTADEAWSFKLVTGGPISAVFTTHIVANHVLQSLLSLLSRRWFGLSEFSLRLPILLCGLLYLGTAFALARYVFGRGWVMAAAVAVLTLNPFLLDFLSAARGYGPGVALFLWAFYEVVRHFGDGRPWRLYGAGVALGLAVAMNLVFAFPALALGIVVFAAAIADKRFWMAVDDFAGPAIVAAFVFLVVPMTRAQPADFYYGGKTLRDTAASIAGYSLLHSQAARAFAEAWLGGLFWMPAVAPCILVGSAAAAAWMAARRLRIGKLDAVEAALLAAGGAFALTVATVAALHYGAGVPYPLCRTAIYFIPLASLVCLAGAVRLWRAGAAGRIAAVPVIAFLIAGVALYAAGFTTSYYAEWLYDRGTSRMMRTIRDRENGRRQVRVGLSWEFEPTVNFYRRRYRMGWVREATRSGPDGEYDYYLLQPRDQALVAKRGLKVLQKDELAGTVLAAP